MRQLESQYPDGQMLRSMRIYSTIDLNLQRLAYQAVARNMIEVASASGRRENAPMNRIDTQARQAARTNTSPVRVVRSRSRPSIGASTAVIRANCTTYRTQATIGTG